MTTEAPGEPVALHPLTFLEEGDEVTVGRADASSYIVIPADGAGLLRQLAAGRTQRQAAEWYLGAYGEQVDVADFVAGLREAGFVLAEGEVAGTVRPVRWQRLGAAVFSAAGGACLAALVAAWCTLMIRYPVLVPGYRQAFFTRYVTVIELVAFLGQVPLLLVHEGAHMLAGRRLGLPTRLSASRRLYYIVLVTSMDALAGVERRKRYLPMLAGILADLAACSVLALIAWLTMGPGGQLRLAGRIALALSLTTVLRITWQFYLYLQTDLYYVLATALRCTDLHAVARQMLRNRFLRLLRPGHAPASEPAWHPRDRAVARWYSWLILGGYAFSLSSLVIAVPTVLRIASLCASAVRAGQPAREADAAIFIALNATQALVLGWLVLREHRGGRTMPAGDDAA
jgi:hypothetical protein